MRRTVLIALVALVGLLAIGVTVVAAQSGSDSGDAQTPVLGPPLSPQEHAALTGAGPIDVVDNDGNIRGYMDQGESARQIPGTSIYARRVFSKRTGEVVGYMTKGHAGFVDLALAGDPASLTKLEGCLDIRHNPDTRGEPTGQACDQAMRSVGIEP